MQSRKWVTWLAASMLIGVSGFVHAQDRIVYHIKP